MSHFERPKGKRVPGMSLAPIAPALAKAIGQDVRFVDDCIGPQAADAIKQLGNGQVVLLENLRFHKGEEDNDPAFVRELASLGDIYVNDAFSTAHRAHASTEGLAHVLPAFAGREMQGELEALGAALENPKKPVAALVGGAKISGKLEVLNHLIERVDMLIIGGAMANTFLFAEGLEVGKSLYERDLADTARAILAKAEAKGCELVLPIDAVVTDALKEGAIAAFCKIDAVPADKMIVDIGAATAWKLDGKLARCRTLLWNGPLGAFEVKPFDAGTVHVARTAARLTKSGQLVSVAGGGDTIAALNAAGVEDQFTYVSSAGGAFLEWLEGKTLPGVAALMRD
jgi:phosphoglycerate kinase